MFSKTGCAAFALLVCFIVPAHGQMYIPPHVVAQDQEMPPADSPMASMSSMPARESQGQCPQPPLSISIETENAPVRYEYSSNGAQLGRNVGGHMSGMISFRILPDLVPDPASGCIILRSIRAIVSSQQTIRIANEFPAGSCLFNVIKNHENRHLRVLENFLDTVPATMEPVLAGMFYNNTGYRRDEAEMLLNKLRSAGQTLKSQITHQHNELQYNNVDRPDLVDAETRPCFTK